MRWVALCLLAIACGGADGGRIAVAGFPEAPEFGAVEWLAGEPVEVGAGDRVYLVELWATWCGPCIEQFPHLARVQAEHADRLTVVALSDEHPAQVRPFVKRRAEEMAFTVAVDAGGGTSRQWAAFGGENSIPYAFLVQGGRVLWDGHPAQLDPILESVLAGTWTPTLAADLEQVKELRAEYHHLLAEGHPDEARAIGHRVLGVSAVAPGAANDLAWEILTAVPAELRDLPLALELAEAANGATKSESHAILDTYALALFESGRVAEAVTAQKAAVTLCRAAASSCGELEDRLERFERG